MLGKRLNYDFFNNHPKNVACLLLGKYLVRNLSDGKIVTKIIETEAYGCFEDKACHVGRFGKTKRTEKLFGSVGFSYVYPVHINTYCLNIICHKKNQAGGILFRSIEIVSGSDLVKRNIKLKSNIINGPGRLCRALLVDKSLDYIDIIKGEILFITEGEKIDKSQILSTPRINIPYAGISKSWKWRFLIKEYIEKL